MDVRMPNMDGLAATRTIRARGGAALTLPIIALTANAFAEDILLCREAGMSDFLAKPLRKPALVAAVLRALRGGAGGAAPQSAQPALDGGPAPLDLGTVTELLADIGKSDILEMIAVFVGETDRRLKLFRQFADGQDREAIGIEAHSLKGGAATLGLLQVVEIARTIELQAGRISAGELRELARRLEAALLLARHEFDDAVALAA
jgi:CheY-like chemotaxis protein